jgi:hypothetical protein
MTTSTFSLRGAAPSTVDACKYASGEKLVETSNREELRHRYDVFETVVNAIASSARPPTSEQLSKRYPPLPTYLPKEVKHHSLSDLISRGRETGGGMTKEEVIRLLYQCEPLLQMKFTWDEIMRNRPFRDICGLPEYYEDYQDELFYHLGIRISDDEDEEREGRVQNAGAVGKTRIESAKDVAESQLKDDALASLRTYSGKTTNAKAIRFMLRSDLGDKGKQVFELNGITFTKDMRFIGMSSAPLWHLTISATKDGTTVPLYSDFDGAITFF